MKTPEKSPPDLAEIGRLAVQAYLAKRAHVQRATSQNADAQCGGVDLYAAKIRAELEKEEAILNYLATKP